MQYGTSDQIRIPMPDGTYRDYPVTLLLGQGYSQLSSSKGMGSPPINILTQSGPLQDGSTALRFQYGNRGIQIGIRHMIDHRDQGLRETERIYDLLDLLRPSRNFPDLGGVTKPLIYRRWLPGGLRISGEDGVLTNGSAYFTSPTGRFTHYGLRPGSALYINPTGALWIRAILENVINDSTVEWANWGAATVTEVPWYYTSEPRYRDLYCYMELGPQFDRNEDLTNGILEIVRFIATDPLWYGAEQEVEFTIPQEFDNLVFDFGDTGVDDADAGAAFEGPDGRWIFSENYVTVETDLYYWGHEGAVPRIEIIGPARNVVISNEDLSRQIAYTTDINDGEVVTIDTFNLTATSSVHGDVLAYLTGDLTGFLISPNAANDRENTIRITFSDADIDASVKMYWSNRYAGI